jgi:1-acyl-sn-glycerol-3-phosphate acyltransferase
MVLYAVWPRQPRLAIYGPKEEDMRRGLRNRLISWTGAAVPYRPGKDDLLSSARRGLAVLRAGRVLAIAPEGRLSEQEDVVEPFQEGAAFLAIRAGVPLVPLAINGTRWLRFGKVVRIRLGRPIPTTGLRADRATLARLTAELQGQLETLVQGYPDTAEPGPFGRWLTELFADRPWRLEGESGATDDPASGAPGVP